MTQHNQSQNTTRSSMKRILSALSVAAAFGSVLALSQEAQAGERCNSKPAVCAMQAMEKANKAKQAEKAVAPVETKKVVRIKRCTSKPAVCAMQRETQPKAVVVTEVVRQKPAVKACTSKPAVCALQKSREANKAQN